ncbi:thiolase family protein [Oxyplasma meridianum]|uniref:Thiolase family protein n=1 Tax=Oxyplasma meridianum TaxID=3073602 RepID=A0AAX4NIQ3_9ARCH
MSVRKLEEAYVVESLRTPIGRRNGSLRDLHPVDLLGDITKAMIRKTSVEPSQIEDFIIGCVSQAGDQGFNIARNAWISAGLPESVPGVTLDRQCGSSLQALQFATAGIMSGQYSAVMAGGVESMTRVPLGSTINSTGNPITLGLKMRYGLEKEWFSQAKGAELIANNWHIKREEMDTFSFNSHRKAFAASESMQREIVPVKIGIKQDETGEFITFDHDEGVRPNADLNKMRELPPAFTGLKLITAGNSSQISDGSSLSLIANDEFSRKNNLKPRAKVIETAVVGVNPVTMLTGPIPVTRKLLERAGMSIDQIDLFEVNEAFAPVVLAWQEEFDVPSEKLNVHGGAIALGHPLGATGTRILATMINALELRGKKIGLIAICEGGGMANGAIIEKIQE